MELNEMEKKLLFQVEGDYQTKILNELYMTVRYSNNSEQREAAEGLMAKLRVLSNAECMDLVKDIQKNYRLPYPARTIGEKIAEARQQSGAEKLKGHDIMALERFDPEVKHMIVFDVTQNVKDLLASREIENIFENSDFIYMLNQAQGDRQILAKQLGISPHQLSYVTHSGPGEGLLFFGNVIIPFVDHFPKDTLLYSVLTTRPDEVAGTKA